MGVRAECRVNVISDEEQAVNDRRKVDAYSKIGEYAEPIGAFDQVIVYENVLVPGEKDKLAIVEAHDSHNTGSENAVSGWRVYFDWQNKEEKGIVDGLVRDLPKSDNWFSVTAKGVDVVGVYFPEQAIQRRNDNESRQALSKLIRAADAYFRGTGAIVCVPKSVNLETVQINPHRVNSPWSGRGEFCIDFLATNLGDAKVNGITKPEEDLVFMPDGLLVRRNANTMSEQIAAK